MNWAGFALSVRIPLFLEFVMFFMYMCFMISLTCHESPRKFHSLQNMTILDLFQWKDKDRYSKQGIRIG